MIRKFKQFAKDERGDVGLVFKVIVGVVVGVAVLGLLLSMLNIVSFGTNKFAVNFDKAQTTCTGCSSFNKDNFKETGGELKLGSNSGTVTIKGFVKNEKGGYVENAQVEIAGAGAQDLVITDKDGKFSLKSEFNLGGTPFGTATISFKKDGFVRQDITIVVKK